MAWNDIKKETIKDDGVMQPTSLWAKLSVDHMTLQEKVLCELKISDSTDQELETKLGISGNSIRPARGACRKKGWVVPTGETRKTKSGMLANVWKLSADGILEARRVMDLR